MGASFPQVPWKITLDLNALVPLFDTLPEGENAEVPEGMPEAIGEAIKAAWVLATTDPIPDALESIIIDITNADEAWEVRQEWESFYDWCDAARIWVDTHS